MNQAGSGSFSFRCLILIVQLNKANSYLFTQP